MRTTVDIDPDLLKRLRQSADEQGISFREVLGQVIRRGLVASGSANQPPFVMPTHSFGSTYFDVNKALSVAFELEDEAMLRKMDLAD